MNDRVIRDLARFLGVTEGELRAYPPGCLLSPREAMRERDRRAAAAQARGEPMNLNPFTTVVRVRLTPWGRAAWDAHRARSGLRPAAVPEEAGVSTWQLGYLMAAMGPALYSGPPLFHEDRIEVLPPGGAWPALSGPIGDRGRVEAGAEVAEVKGATDPRPGPWHFAVVDAAVKIGFFGVTPASQIKNNWDPFSQPAVRPYRDESRGAVNCRCGDPGDPRRIHHPTEPCVEKALAERIGDRVEAEVLGLPEREETWRDRPPLL